MKRWTKRTLIALAAVAALAGDSWATYRLTAHPAVRAASAGVQTGSAADPIERFRLEREQLRARQQAQLNDIIYNAQSDQETVADAQRRLMEALKCAEQELTLEGVLQGRGFEDALVTVGEHSANVLLRRETLTQRETAVILELVMRQTGLTGGNVKIIPVK